MIDWRKRVRLKARDGMGGGWSVRRENSPGQWHYIFKPRILSITWRSFSISVSFSLFPAFHSSMASYFGKWKAKWITRRRWLTLLLWATCYGVDELNIQTNNNNRSNVRTRSTGAYNVDLDDFMAPVSSAHRTPRTHQSTTDSVNQLLQTAK